LQKGGDLGYCLSPNVLEILGAIGDPHYNEYHDITGRGIMSLQCMLKQSETLQKYDNITPALSIIYVSKCYFHKFGAHQFNFIVFIQVTSKIEMSARINEMRSPG
jgi:hypothetical protein